MVNKVDIGFIKHSIRKYIKVSGTKWDKINSHDYSNRSSLVHLAKATPMFDCQIHNMC